MIRLIASLSLATVLCSCGSLQPVTDNSRPATLILADTDSAAPVYPAPVFSVNLPSYLNQSTVWYADGEGNLTALADFIWAESISKAIQRELSLALAREKPFAPDSRIEVNFARFILLDDGSGLAIAEMQLSTPGSEKTFPIVKTSVQSLWNPENPSTYLKGYRNLLKSTIASLSQALNP